LAKRKSLNKKSRLQIVIGAKGIFLLITICLIAIVWAFIVGVIVGRGYGPIDLLSFSVKKTAKQEKKKIKSNHENKVLDPSELTFYEKVRQNSLEKLLKTNKDYLKNKSSSIKQQGQKYQYTFQVASFRSKEDALALSKEIKKKGLVSWIEEVLIEKRPWYRVYVQVKGRSIKIKNDIQKLKNMGLTDFIILKKKKL